MSSFEYKFLTEPEDELKCMICLEVARDPLQHEECGKLFCKTCLEKHGRHNPCPNCRKHRPQYYADRRGKRKIDALEVTCSNAKRKCNWQGALGSLDTHMAICEFTLIPCPNNCSKDDKNAIRFTRKELEDHLKNNCPNRDYKCPDCGKEGKYSTITQEHEKVCTKRIVFCYNKDCIMIMPREKVPAHMANECLYTLMPCKYHIIGCKTRCRRCDLAEHEDDDKLHLRMVMDATLELQRESVTLQVGESFKFAVTDIQGRLKHSEAYEPPSFYTNPRGYHLTAYVYVKGRGSGKGTHISAYVKIATGKYDSELEWPLTGTFTITLLNQYQNNFHHSKSAGFSNGNVGDKRGHSQFFPHNKLSYASGTPQYLKNDTLYFCVTASIPSCKHWLNCTVPPPPSRSYSASLYSPYADT